MGKPMSELEILQHVNGVRRSESKRPLTLEELQAMLGEMSRKGYILKIPEN